MDAILCFGLIIGWAGTPLRFRFPCLFDLAVNKECTVEEMAREGWGEGGRAWVWRRRMLAWEEESVRECLVLLHNIVLQDDVNDRWSWLIDPTHSYSVRDAYHLITSFGEQVDRSPVVDVWHRNIPAKVSLFVWRLFRDILPVRANLLLWNILSAADSFCAAGCEVLETSRHLFLECDTSTNLSYHVWN